MNENAKLLWITVPRLLLTAFPVWLKVKNMSQILDDNRELKRQCDLLERELSEAKLHLSQLRGGRAPTSRLEQVRHSSRSSPSVSTPTR